MIRTIITCKGLIFRVHLSKNNTTVFDSYKVKGYKDMKYIILRAAKGTPLDYAINKRSILSMINEWRVHNLLYSLGIQRNRTKDVDLNIGQPWYVRVLYLILSPLYFHFK